MSLLQKDGKNMATEGKEEIEDDEVIHSYHVAVTSLLLKINGNKEIVEALQEEIKEWETERAHISALIAQSFSSSSLSEEHDKFV